MESDGQYSGRQGPVDETIDQTIKGYDLSFTKSLRTHGDELWFLDAVGVHGASPAAVSGSTPQVYTKEFRTDADGPTGSYTIAVDRFTLQDGTNDLTQSVFAGCMTKSWGVSVSADNPVEVTTDYVARSVVDATGRSSPTTAAYAHRYNR